jgi:glycosyltransferase involved in cell wall biosynthesis
MWQTTRYGLCKKPQIEYMNQAPKVLYICERLPHNVRGGKDLRVRGQVLALTSFCNVGVIGLSDFGPSISKKITVWKSGNFETTNYQQKLINSLFVNDSNETNPYRFLYDKTIARLIEESITSFNPDIIIFSQMHALIYIDVVNIKTGIKVFLDLDESAHSQIEYLKPLSDNLVHRIMFNKWYEKLKNHEDLFLRNLDQVWLSSNLEIDTILRNNPILKNLKLVQNAICVEDYDYMNRRYDPRKITFTSNFAYGPNLKAVSFIIEELAKSAVDFDFYLAGSNIPTWLKSIENENVNIAENIENMSNFLSDAFVSIVPLTEGCGTRFKILEAFACGVPVISTYIGATGLEVIPGHHYIQANTSQQFVDALRIFQRDPKLYAKISINALEFVQENYSISKLAKNLQSLIGLSS